MAPPYLIRSDSTEFDLDMDERRQREEFFREIFTDKRCRLCDRDIDYDDYLCEHHYMLRAKWHRWNIRITARARRYLYYVRHVGYSWFLTHTYVCPGCCTVTAHNLNQFLLSKVGNRARVIILRYLMEEIMEC